MSSSAQLGALLSTQAELNYYTMLQNYWGDKYEANMKKLQEQVSLETKYEDAYDSAIDNSRELSVCHNGQYIFVQECNQDTALADRYATAKVSKYDEELSLELAELDIDYETQKTIYEALVTMLQEEKTAQKQSTATACQDTHQLQS